MMKLHVSGSTLRPHIPLSISIFPVKPANKKIQTEVRLNALFLGLLLVDNPRPEDRHVRRASGAGSGVGGERRLAARHDAASCK